MFIFPHSTLKHQDSTQCLILKMWDSCSETLLNESLNVNVCTDLWLYTGCFFPPLISSLGIVLLKHFGNFAQIN